MTTPHDNELKEKLAAIEHERWADWQKYMHSKFVEHENGKGEWVCLPAELFKRWERQIATKYADLPASEKQSDRDQVDRYWPLIQSLLERRDRAARIEELNNIKPEFEMIPLIRGWSPYPWATMPPEDQEEAKIWQACHSHAAFYFEEKINNRIAELSQRGEAGD